MVQDLENWRYRENINIKEKGIGSSGARASYEISCYTYASVLIQTNNYNSLVNNFGNVSTINAKKEKEREGERGFIH